jgi:predicted AlkP superfamily phosphohydrolase/phosphomutase
VVSRSPPSGRRRAARVASDVPAFLHRSLLFPERATRRFFAVPNNAVAGAVRINLAGRDANGRVRPEDYDGVCEELRRELLALVDTATGEPWVRDIARPRDRHPGPFTDELPDLVAEWNRTRPLPVVASPRLGTVSPPAVTGRTGDHVNHGRSSCAGRDPRGRSSQPVETVDIAPTLCRLVGVALEDVDGEPIGACLPD